MQFGEHPSVLLIFLFGFCCQVMHLCFTNILCAVIEWESNLFWKILNMCTEDHSWTYLEIWDSWYTQVTVKAHGPLVFDTNFRFLIYLGKCILLHETIYIHVCKEQFNQIIIVIRLLKKRSLSLEARFVYLSFYCNNLHQQQFTCIWEKSM
jgi:hypothetical protein